MKIIEDKIRNEIKIAMKSGNSLKRDILRLVLGEIQLQAANHAVLEEDIIKIIQKTIKNNKETLNLTENLEKKDILEQEIKILEEFLPAVMNEAETREYIKSLGIDFSKLVGGARIGAVKKNVVKPMKSLDNSILIKILSEF